MTCFFENKKTIQLKHAATVLGFLGRDQFCSQTVDNVIRARRCLLYITLPIWLLLRSNRAVFLPRVPPRQKPLMQFQKEKKNTL